MTNALLGHAKERIKFKNPPIVELVVSLFHLPLPELKAQHIGIYWDRARKKYPLCQQQNLVANPSERQPLQLQQPLQLMRVPGEVFPLPRFWFYSDDHPTLVQVQRNAFFFNWRRLPSFPPSEYPHYEKVMEDFWRELEDYKVFIQEHIERKLDPIRRCELTYVNMITPK
jgi:uncharacterized protein (TIGR04255 family)